MKEAEVSKNGKWNAKWVVTSLLAAIGSSICCITPILAVIAGASEAASAFSWLEPVRPYLMGGTVLVLGYAWYQRLKPQTQEAIECACETDEQPSFWQTKKFLGMITVVVGLLLTFPYYSGMLLPESQASAVNNVNEQNIEKAEFAIEGMTCTGCEQSIDYTMNSRESVVKASSSYEQGQTVIKYDRSKTSKSELARYLEAETGYKVLTKTAK